MPRRSATPYRSMAPTAPRRRPVSTAAEPVAVPTQASQASVRSPLRAGLHPLTDRQANGVLHAYDNQVKGSFDHVCRCSSGSRPSNMRTTLLARPSV